MNAVSPWASAVKSLFQRQDLPAIYNETIAGYFVKVHILNNALWISVTCPKGTQVVLRPAYDPNDHLQVEKIVSHADGVSIHLFASIGHDYVRLQIPDMQK